MSASDANSAAVQAAPPTPSRLPAIAIAAGVAVLALGGAAWLANADAIFIELANAAIAMCM